MLWIPIELLHPVVSLRAISLPKSLHFALQNLPVLAVMVASLFVGIVVLVVCANRAEC